MAKARGPVYGMDKLPDWAVRFESDAYCEIRLFTSRADYRAWLKRHGKTIKSHELFRAAWIPAKK